MYVCLRGSALWMSAVISVLSSPAFVNAQEPDQVTAADLADAHLRFDGPTGSTKIRPSQAAILRDSVQGIDSIQTFGGFYSVLGYDPNGLFKTNWSYNMAGNSPANHRTTTFDAPVVPVSVLMLNADGTPRYVKGQLLYSDATQYVSKVLDSPIFAKHEYSSSHVPTQFVDAVQRAEFWKQIEDDEGAGVTGHHGWHTLLNPKAATPRVMLLPYGSYRFGLNADGSCCAVVLVDINTFGNLLFPATYPFDGSTIVGAAELAGDITTKDISSFVFPNTYLYLNGNPKDCCVGGYHNFDYEPGIPSNGNLTRFYVLNYSSWISPGLFGPGAGDITALSHELAETFNDPFIDNITPWWLAPNGLCQDILEVGDVVEGLPNDTYPIKMNGFTYHPQNEALLPWFEFKAKPDSIDGAYSYPNTTVITALSPLEKAFCK